MGMARAFRAGDPVARHFVRISLLKEKNVTDRSKSALAKSRVRKAAFSIAEFLEPRAYLTGLVLGSPVNTTTASLGLSPVFANLFPFVTGSNKADLFVANSTNSVSVLISNGDGSFSSNVDTIPVQGTPLPLQVGDFNGDGIPDIVAGTTGPSSGDISIILGNGDGTFKAANNIPALANNQAIAVAAFRDSGPDAGKEDIITVSNSASNNNNAAIIFGDGAGGAKSVNPFSLPFGSATAVATGDFNGDGHQDFLVLSQQTNSVAVFLGNGDGTFKLSTTYATGPSPTSVVVGNFRNKTLAGGKPELDIVTADSTGGEVSFLANNGDGTFAAPVNSAVEGSAVGGGPLKVRLTDFNGDNIPDLLVLQSPGGTGDAVAMLGNGDGTFHTGTVISTGGGTRNAIAAGDLKGLGLTDVVLTNSSQITSLLNITNGDIMPPTAAVNPNPPAGSTSTNVYDFTVTYTDAQQVDAATLGNGNLVVTFPDGTTTQAATFVSTNTNGGNASTVIATYSITLPSNLSAGNVGAYSVAINANSVKNANNIAVAAGNIGSFNLTVTNSNIDTTPPTALVNASQPAGSTSASIYQFTVTYTDNVSVDASTISNNNLVVTFPNSSTQNATLISTGLTNGPTIQAVYQITFPANLDTTDNGSYGVTINGSSVKDTSGNAVAGGSIGSFMLNVSSSQPPPGPTGDLTVSAPTGKILTAVVTGSRQGPLRVRLTNNGTGPIAGPITGTVTIKLYTSSTIIHDSSAVQVKRLNGVPLQVVRKVRNLKVGKSLIVVFPAFKFPSTAGLDFIVADAAIGGTLDSTDGASPVINVAAPFVHGVAKSVTTSRPTLVEGKRYVAFLSLQNAGNITYTGPATVDVAVSQNGGTQTSIGAATVHLHLLAGRTGRVAVSFIPSGLPAAGSGYALTLTINIPGDNTATSATSVTLLTI
jgi:hypothetical protein